jgi:hypothetical protein
MFAENYPYESNKKAVRIPQKRKLRKMSIRKHRKIAEAPDQQEQ